MSEKRTSVVPVSRMSCSATALISATVAARVRSRLDGAAVAGWLDKGPPQRSAALTIVTQMKGVDKVPRQEFR
jgi:hypothetical protein